MRGECYVSPENGTRRVVTKFAWFPVCTKEHEWRWLENVTVEQEYENNYGNYDCWEHEKWKTLRFIDEARS